MRQVVHFVKSEIGLIPPLQQTGWFHHIFPNIFYFLLPDHIFLVILHPTGTGETVEEAHMLVHESLLLSDGDGDGEKKAGEGEATTTATARMSREELDKKFDEMFAFYDMYVCTYVCMYVCMHSNMYVHPAPPSLSCFCARF